MAAPPRVATVHSMEELTMYAMYAARFTFGSTSAQLAAHVLHPSCSLEGRGEGVLVTSSSQSADARYTLAPCVPCLARGAENIIRRDVSVYEVARKASPNAHDARGAAVNALVRGFMATLEPCSAAPAVRVAAPSDGGECEGYAMPLPLPCTRLSTPYVDTNADLQKASIIMHTRRRSLCKKV